MVMGENFSVFEKTKKTFNVSVDQNQHRCEKSVRYIREGCDRFTHLLWGKHHIDVDSQYIPDVITTGMDDSHKGYYCLGSQ